MLTSFARLALTATAIAPVSLTYAWVAFFQAQYVVAVLSLTAAAILLVLCISLLSYVRSQLEVLPFAAQTVEPADAENLGFMLLYLLPLFTDDISTLNWELWVPVVAVFSIIVATGYGYHFNPLLGLLRWHFYKVTSDSGVSYVLITKKHLRRCGRSGFPNQLIADSTLFFAESSVGSGFDVRCRVGLLRTVRGGEGSETRSAAA